MADPLGLTRVILTPSIGFIGGGPAVRGPPPFFAIIRSRSCPCPVCENLDNRTATTCDVALDPHPLDEGLPFSFVRRRCFPALARTRVASLKNMFCRTAGVGSWALSV